MESVDMKKLETAIIYLQRIADGNNPINNLPAEEDSVLNNPNVIRCMFFVKEVLEEVKRNNGYIGKKAKKGAKLEFPTSTLDSFVYKEDKAITRFVEQLNESVNADIYQKVKYRSILQWLKLNGFLKEEYSQEFNKTITLPTDFGLKIGIRVERKTSSSGNEYLTVIYGKPAQEYIVKNLKEILHNENMPRNERG